MLKKNILSIYCSIVILALQISVSLSTFNVCENGSGCCDVNVVCQQGSTSEEVICACKKGFTNTGRNGKLICKDSCHINNGGCAVGTQCIHCPETNAVKCECKKGFTNVTNDGKTECIDSCTIENGGCGDNAICFHDRATNAVVCRCSPGFVNVQKNGVTICKDVCSVNNGGCCKRAVCLHRPGSSEVICKCKPGYTDFGLGLFPICIDSCFVLNGGCGLGAFCGHNPNTNEVVCRCKPGFTNVGTDTNVKCKLNLIPIIPRKPCRPVIFDADKDHHIEHNNDDDERLDGVLKVKLCRPSLFIHRPYRCTSIFSKLHDLFKAHLLKAGIRRMYPIDIGKVEGDGDEAKFHYSVSCDRCDAKQKEAVKLSLQNACRDRSFVDTINREKQPVESESSSESSHK